MFITLHFPRLARGIEGLVRKTLRLNTVIAGSLWVLRVCERVCECLCVCVSLFSASILLSAYALFAYCVCCVCGIAQARKLRRKSKSSSAPSATAKTHKSLTSRGSLALAAGAGPSEGRPSLGSSLGSGANATTLSLMQPLIPPGGLNLGIGLSLGLGGGLGLGLQHQQAEVKSQGIGGGDGEGDSSLGGDGVDSNGGGDRIGRVDRVDRVDSDSQMQTRPALSEGSDDDVEENIWRDLSSDSSDEGEEDDDEAAAAVGLDRERERDRGGHELLADNPT